MKKGLLYASLIMLLLLTACSFDLDELEAKNTAEQNEKKEYIMEQIELKLIKKYSMFFSDEQAFDVYDLGKGSNKAWFQYGVYPTKAVSYLYGDASEEFDVQIETNGERFGPMEDNYYGILYGEKPKEELADLVSAYPLENVVITYEPCEEMPRAYDDLKKHLYVRGEYHAADQSEVDELCELVDMLNSVGYCHRISIYNDNKKNSSMGRDNIPSIEVRHFFEDE